MWGGDGKAWGMSISVGRNLGVKGPANAVWHLTAADSLVIADTVAFLGWRGEDCEELLRP